MAELTHASEDTAASRNAESAGGARVARRGWSTRGALFFWIAVSGVVWIALAASAIWFAGT